MVRSTSYSGGNKEPIQEGGYLSELSDNSSQNSTTEFSSAEYYNDIPNKINKKYGDNSSYSNNSKSSYNSTSELSSAEYNNDIPDKINKKYGDNSSYSNDSSSNDTHSNETLSDLTDNF